MDFAKKITDNEPVFAEEYIDTSEDPYGFFCPYDQCGTEMRLKSYNSQKNKRAPYFAPRFTDKPHTEKCTVNSNKKTIKTNGIDNSAPVPYKNKLVFENKNELGGSVNKILFASEKGNESFKDSNLIHNRTTKNIASVIRWYLKNPSKGDKGLEVPNCQHRLYKTIFQRIYQSPKKEYQNTHIFFGTLYFLRPFEEQENKIIFNLYQDKQHDPIKLVINTSGWKESSKNFVKQLVIQALKISKEAYKKNNKSVYPYVFFLGGANRVSRRSFNCNRHEAFYAIAIKNLQLPSSNKGIYFSPPPPLINIKEDVKLDTVIEVIQEVSNNDDGKSMVESRNSDEKNGIKEKYGKEQKPSLRGKVRNLLKTFFGK